jgi:hypothetical protein
VDDIDYEIRIENLNSSKYFYLLIFIFNIFMIVLGVFLNIKIQRFFKYVLEFLYLLVVPIGKKQSFGVGFGHNFGSNLIQFVSPSRSLCLHMMDGHVP